MQIESQAAPHVEYDECGPDNPLWVQLDLSNQSEVLAVASVGPGLAHDGSATLTILRPEVESPEGVRRVAGWLSDKGEMEATARAVRGQRLMLGISGSTARHLAEGVGNEAPSMELRVVRRITGASRDQHATIRVAFEAYRSRQTAPHVRVIAEPVVDVGRDAGIDGYVRLCRVTIERPPTKFDSRLEPARLVVTVVLRPNWVDEPFDFATRMTTVRPIDPETGSEAPWRDAGREPTAVALPLSLFGMPAEALDLEIGITRDVLRRSLQRRSSNVTVEDLRLHVLTTVEFAEGEAGSGVTTALPKSEVDILLRGALSESLTVSSTTGAQSLSWSTPNAAAAPHLITLPAFRFARQSGDKMEVDFLPAYLPLYVSYDGAADTARLDISAVIEVDGVALGKPRVQSDLEFEGSSRTVAVEIPVRRLEHAARGEHPELFKNKDRFVLALHCRLARKNASDSEQSVVEFDVHQPLEVDSNSTDWLACIDLGTSSIGIWLGHRPGGEVRAASTPGLPLRLGDWLARIDKQHDESTAITGARVSHLLPSHVGLSSVEHFRARFDPLSFGDLRLAGSDAAAVGRRLASLQRTTDVSVPFPSAEKIPEHADRIVFEPKKKLILAGETLPLDAEVLVTDSQAASGSSAKAVRSVQLEDVVIDVFDELGSYVVPRVLAFMAAEDQTHGSGADGQGPRGAEALEARELMKAWSSGIGELDLVLTHPSGIDPVRKRIYRRAGMRFLRTAGRTEENLEKGVRLVGEALAAARYGIQAYCDDCTAQRRPARGWRRFVTLDIGAGTYDVTVLDADLTDAGPREWKIHSHFGMTIGGRDLDRAIAGRVQTILRRAATLPDIAQAFKIEADLPRVNLDLRRFRGDAGLIRRDMGFKYLRELQVAKATATRRLLADPNSAYRFGSGKDADAFEVLLGLPPDQVWPITLGSGDRAARPERRQDYPIEGLPASIVTGLVENRPTIRLRLERGALDGSEKDFQGDELDRIVRVLGQELPSMAFSEVERVERGDVKEAPLWIVTGRAALWPPLFEAISATVGRLGAKAGRLVRDKPFEPEEMKSAVMKGAIRLAFETWLDRDQDVFNPLAIISYAGPYTGGRTAEIDRPNSIRYVTASDIARGTWELHAQKPFAIVRAVPGLDRDDKFDERVQLIRSLGIEPWSVLSNTLAPQDIGRGDAPGYHLVWERSAAGLNVQVRDNDGHIYASYGPLAEGRMYGK